MRLGFIGYKNRINALSSLFRKAMALGHLASTRLSNLIGKKCLGEKKFIQIFLNYPN